ncbi:citrate transporter [Enterococcus raffinosus]|uniref:Citrate transporter n=1 Tax=Enterococcus raffinosus TaxID=71452 RepID=A0AAW8T760_9ENTE|nr:citrate transporter [Enterococcus raffinosus]MDT2521751.1 citrate transporter [Enterococcus raffinosus]MDT2529060.1 citrate transporter [Enterococcus raffinosus]MDT2532734.1 citrate transporter [Enterococcus raffinosus]MDT2544399.1 citrate transporter [Enterococcus raffinosus]MDT2554689.1 citrate transporter [Enterococcus raffinosus]
MDILIGILLICSFVGMVIFCIKGHNLMVGFFIMATIWTVLPIIGNLISPNEVFAGMTITDMLKTVYQTAPEKYGASLMNIFLGAFFGRILLDTGIASTIIRKSVELGGDNPAIILAIVNLITGFIFTSMTGAGSVIAIAVIILPILFSIGIPKVIAFFSFTGSVAAGLFLNPINFAQYSAFFLNSNGGAEYSYSDYFPFGILAFLVMIVVVSIAAMIYLRVESLTYAWAATKESKIVDAPGISLITPFLPVVGVILLDLPVILCFILASLYALAVCGVLKGGFREICRTVSRIFTEGVKDTSSLVAFWITLAMFNDAAFFAAPYFEKIIGGIIPTAPLALCILFGILAPLTWFKGPLSLIGSGAALLAVVSQTTNYPTTFLYPLFASVLIGMAHFDITISWNAWGLSFNRINAIDYMKVTFVPGIIVALILEIANFLLNNPV